MARFDGKTPLDLATTQQMKDALQNKPLPPMSPKQCIYRTNTTQNLLE